MAAAIVFCIFAASIGIAGVYWHRNYSLSYQIGKAKECAQGGQYTQAIIYLEKARTLDGENGEILFLMADYYYIQEKYELAIDTLIEIVEAEERYSEAEVESAYDKVISIYSKMEDYQAIHELLSDCTNEAVVNLFQQFIAKPPEFSFVEGNYEEVLPLKLSANTSGKIYYTLDGSTPDEKSEIYTAPIFLETGEYTVKACFINDYGVKSDIVSNTYRIDVLIPAAPEVSVYSGDYYEPYMIEAQAPENCNIYYTTDSTDPTADSTLYTSAIPMPLGKSVYKFVAISEEGVASEITMRTYKLTLHTEITVDMAESFYNIVNANFIGKPAAAMHIAKIQTLAVSLGERSLDMTPLLVALADVAAMTERTELLLEGQSNLLGYKEYAENAYELIEFLRHGELLGQIFSGYTNSGKHVPQVLIGQENRFRELQNSSMVFDNYEIAGHESGTLGLIGPTRMDYARLIPSLRYLTEIVGKMLSDTVEE